MRVQLSDADRLGLFENLERKKLNLSRLAKTIGVSERTARDWRRGKYTMPDQHFNKIAEMAGIKQQLLKARLLNDWWNNGEAGRKGAAVRMQKYGPLGTLESRRLGGMNSYINQKDNIYGIFTPRAISKPSKSELLAEFIGILIGDGGVTKYQVTVATNSVDDYEYGLFVASLIKQLFDVQPTLTKRKNMNCTTITVSSVELVKFLKLNGVLQGDKIRQGLDIPTWIQSNEQFSIACIRGIFDTDGCIFQETHKIKQKTYSYQRWSLVSASPYLRETICKILADLEFRPKIRNNRSVNLESLIDISKYFKLIGTSNPKHLRRFGYFGGVG